MYDNNSLFCSQLDLSKIMKLDDEFILKNVSIKTAEYYTKQISFKKEQKRYIFDQVSTGRQDDQTIPNLLKEYQDKTVEEQKSIPSTINLYIDSIM